jgi:hypothetical protein
MYGKHDRLQNSRLLQPLAAAGYDPNLLTLEQRGLSTTDIPSIHCLATLLNIAIILWLVTLHGRHFGRP